MGKETAARLNSNLPSFVFPPQLPSISFQPRRYRPNGIGYWSGHIPFACDLVATQRPRMLVELGTHMGESYFTFCQAVLEHHVDCRAFAIDTWVGDEHTGAYDDIVYREIEEHNEEYYSSFSTLLRMSFDEGADRFGAESIDLLHIDGGHTYQEVAHDFELWWPKVRRGGVVLLHDSFERREEFGVWRLLEEVRTTGIPVGDFFHSHGLGVIMKPPCRGDEHVAAAFVEATDECRREMRNYYEACAGRLQAQYLLQKQSCPAEWEVTSQLFWRTEDGVFCERDSIRVAHVLRSTITEVALDIPPCRSRYASFRLALTLLPAALRLFYIRVSDSAGSLIWESKNEEGVLFAGGWNETSLDLSFSSTLQAGGKMMLGMAGVDLLALACDLAQ